MDKPTRRAIRIDPTKTFGCEITLTPEMRERLRKAANSKCMVCLGSGLYCADAGNLSICKCV